MKLRSFSLIELLVITSIFVILASLLTPSLQNIIKASEKIECTEHLRKIASAEMLHVGDYGNYLSPVFQNVVKGSNLRRIYWPTNGKFRVYFEENRLPRCSKFIEGLDDFGWYGRNIAHGSINLSVNKAINIYKVENPSEKVMVSDSTTWLLARYDINASNGWMNQGENAFRGAAFRHLNSSNAAFYDGHVSYLELSDHLNYKLHFNKISYPKDEWEEPFKY